MYSTKISTSTVLNKQDLNQKVLIERGDVNTHKNITLYKGVVETSQKNMLHLHHFERSSETNTWQDPTLIFWLKEV